MGLQRNDDGLLPAPDYTPDLELTEKVREYALDKLESLFFGVADAKILNDYLDPGFRPEDVLPGCKCVIVLSLHIPDNALELMRHGVSNYSYNMFGYAYLNRELDYLIYRMTMFLERLGWSTTPLPARGTQYGAKLPYHGPISYRHCAVAAGLATFGLNGLAITPEYGSRQRFVGIPTTAPLKPAERLLDQSVCDGCMECIRNCPAHALSLNPPHICKLGNRVYRYAQIDATKCRHWSRGLTSDTWKGAPFAANVDVPYNPNVTGPEHYDQLWNQRDARIRVSEHAEATYGATLCGRCMAFCTAGHDAMNRRLRPGCSSFQDDNVLHRDGTLHPGAGLKRKVEGGGQIWSDQWADSHPGAERRQAGKRVEILSKYGLPPTPTDLAFLEESLSIG